MNYKIERDADYAEAAAPSEIWMLRSRRNGGWICSADEEYSFVCQPSEEIARMAARYTEEGYGIPCDPVRVFPPTTPED